MSKTNKKLSIDLYPKLSYTNPQKYNKKYNYSRNG